MTSRSAARAREVLARTREPGRRGGTRRAINEITRSIAFGLLVTTTSAHSSFALELGPQHRVNTVTTGDQDLVSVAAGSDGSFLAAWNSSESDTGDLWVSRYDNTTYNAGAFRDPTMVPVSAGVLQFNPHLASRSGGYWLSYSSEETSISPLYETYLQALDLDGSPSGSAIQVSPSMPATCADGNYDLSVDSAGNVAVYFGTQGAGICSVGGQPDVYVRTFNSAGTPLMMTPLKVNSYDAGEQHVARSAALGENRFVAFWRGASAADTISGCSGRILDAGAHDGGEIQANQTIPGDQAQPVVVARPGGGFLVVWQGYVGTMPAEYGIVARFFDGDGAPDAMIPDEFFVNTQSVAYPSGNPDVAVGSDGNYLVVWRVPDAGTGDSIHGQLLDSTGGKIGTEFEVSEPGLAGDYLDQPVIAADQAGGYLVAWYGPDEDGNGVFARYIGPDTTCGDSIKGWDECCDVGEDNGTHLSGCSSTCACDPCAEGETCCGNGTIEVGEECDDGNDVDDDCCTNECALKCADDGNPCTRDCNPDTFACGSVEAPAAGCRVAGKSGLGLSAGDNGKLQWKWGRGENTYCSDIGSPDDDTEYDLCVYDGTGSGTYSLSRFQVPPGSSWTERNCDWTYLDRDGASDGVRKIKIKSGEPGRSNIGFGAKQPGPIPTPISLAEFMDLDPHVVVQLHNSLGVCWQSEFTDFKLNNETRFRTNRLILLSQ